MEIAVKEFIPMQLAGRTPEELALFFDGPIPKPGDRVEMVCYAADDKSVSLKWRVVAP